MPKRWPGNRAKDPTGKIWFFASSNLIQSTCGDKGRGLTLTQDFISSKFLIGAYMIFFSNNYRQRLCWYILNYVDIFRTVLIYYWLCWYIFCWFYFDKTLKWGKRICFFGCDKNLLSEFFFNIWYKESWEYIRRTNNPKHPGTTPGHTTSNIRRGRNNKTHKKQHNKRRWSTEYNDPNQWELVSTSSPTSSITQTFDPLRISS